MSKSFEYLFHITPKDKLDSILKNGLLPSVGRHCKMVSDDTPPVIFMCQEKDIGFWCRCFKDSENVVLKVNVVSFVQFMKCRKTKTYTEYGAFEAIASDNISIYETDVSKYLRK